MESRTMVTYENGQVQETIEVTDFEYKQVCDLLSNRPLFEVMAELEKLANQGDQEVVKRVGDIENRHRATIQVAQQKVNSLQADLHRTESDLQEVTRTGRYSEGPALEGKKLEIKQAILAAQLELARTNQAAVNERSNYLESLNAGMQGKIPSINGLNFRLIGNVARAVIWDWYYNLVNAGPENKHSQELNDVRWQVQGARGEVAAAEKALADFKTAAQARFSGASVGIAAAQAATQPTSPMTGQQNRFVGGPVIGPNGPQWGSIGSR